MPSNFQVPNSKAQRKIPPPNAQPTRTTPALGCWTLGFLLELGIWSLELDQSPGLQTRPTRCQAISKFQIPKPKGKSHPPTPNPREPRQRLGVGRWDFFWSLEFGVWNLTNRRGFRPGLHDAKQFPSSKFQSPKENPTPQRPTHANHASAWVLDVGISF